MVKYIGSGRQKEGGFLATHQATYASHVRGESDNHSASQITLDPNFSELNLQEFLETVATDIDSGVTKGYVDGYIAETTNDITDYVDAEILSVTNYVNSEILEVTNYVDSEVQGFTDYVDGYIGDVTDYIDSEITGVESQILGVSTNIQLVREGRFYEAILSGTNLTSGDYLTINSSIHNEGFTTFSIGGGGTELRFPQYSSNALNGAYKVEIEVNMNSDVTDPVTTCFLQLTRYDSSGPTETSLRTVQGTRFTDDPAFTTEVRGGIIFDLTGLTTNLARLRVKKVGTGESDISGYIRAYRIGDGGGGSP